MDCRNWWVITEQSLWNQTVLRCRAADGLCVTGSTGMLYDRLCFGACKEKRNMHVSSLQM